jgi:folate-binding protein YgfZ
LLLNTLATLVSMAVATLHAASRPRAYVSVNGPDAAAYLNRMVSNEVESLPVGSSCEALLLTPKARIVAPLVVCRRAEDDFLLLTEPQAGERLARELLRARFAAKCSIEAEQHTSCVILGPGELVLDQHELAVPNRDYGVQAVELLDADPPEGSEPISGDELERLRILARTPRLGAELDDRVMPAEAGLEERAISFTKGCYPGQEPVARLHHRGHPNRGLRVLALSGDGLPAYDAVLTLDGKVVGRVTSAASDPEHGVVGLAYVRREVPPWADLMVDGRVARQLGDSGDLATLTGSPRP